MDISTAITEILTKAAAVDPNSCVPGSTRYPLCATVYGYAPSLPWNALFLSLFAISTLVYFCQGIYYRTWTFTLAMCLGGLCEVIGEIGRLVLHKNPLSPTGFKIQLVFLTFAPAFLAAGIYLNLKHLVLTFGTSFSRIKPAWYTRLFISSDILSIALQGVGGALAATASPTASAPGTKRLFDAGNDIMMAGIILQVVTLVLFGVSALEFGGKVWRGRHELSPHAVVLSQSLKFRCFLAALGTAFVAIFVRCCYRVAEMSGGWGSEVMRSEALFVGLDSTMVVVAMISLNLFHPGSVALGRRTGRKEADGYVQGDRTSIIELNGDRLSEWFQVEKI